MSKLLVVSYVMISAALCIGQTSAELEARYPRTAAYEVRPGISMIAKFADSGQVCELSLEKRHFNTTKGVDLSSNIPRKLIDQLIDELVPAPERGAASSRYLSDDSYVAGGVSYIKRDFENVSIEIHGSTSQSCNGGDEVVVIHWKKRSCATAGSGPNNP
jgi:hypothetical protein